MLRLLADLLRPYRRNVGIILTAMLAQSAMSLAAPWPLKIILDSVVGHTRVPAWMANCLLPLLGGDSKVHIATLAAIIFVAIAAVGSVAFCSELVRADVHHALAGVERGWPAPTDTLCCGTLGSVEFLWEAGGALSRNELQERASRRLLTVIDSARSIGDYRWSNGNSQFNLGLFRGVAGVGYTALRRVDASVPNVAIWE